MDHVEMKPITLPRLEAALQRLLLRQSLDQAPAMTEDAAKPIFDSATYEELFAGSDVDGREWLEGYLSAASGLIDALRRAVAARSAADVAATAHQLAGATLSVGATRAGLLCRALEGAAKTPDWPRLSALAGEVTNALGEACREIDRFADSKGALVP
jgi:HPt (histidine-containing phosphotransfer) domain-containing protein